MKKEYLTPSMLLAKLQKYCAYQDRCHQEVRTKLLKLGARGLDLEVVIAELIKDNFLNEERFAKSYARGKFRINSWGKMKITRELKKRNISDYCIKKGLEEIELKEYRFRLNGLMVKKINTSSEKDYYKLRLKVANHALNKGYESELIYFLLDRILKKPK